MRNTWNKAALVLVASPLLFTACKKNDKGELSGPIPVASFTASMPKTVGLSSQVTFTSTSTDGFLYSWDFGDGTTGMGQTVTHTYQSGGVVKAQLVVSGRGGTGTATQNVTLPAVSDAVKALLTGGTSKTWVLNDTIKVITVGPSDGDVTSYYAGNTAVGQSPACQADDEYTFSAANTLTYDAKGQTFVAGGGGCSTPRNYTVGYTFGQATGTGLAQIDLNSTATGTARPFIAVTDAPDLTYRITSIQTNRMTLRAGKSNSNLVFEIKLKVKGT